MKSRVSPNIYCLLFSGILFPCLVKAQVANWNFNNTLAGTGSAGTTTLNAVLGSAIGSGAYNGGTVYYGEDGWPSGPADPNAYLEFTVNPTSAHSLTIASMLLAIRRSTTGATGSGPNNWSLRSSVDGFAADISNGTLSTSILSIPVSFGAAYANRSVGVTFRLYGYNATVSSGGGLNRFVFDNISISGSSGLLPVVFESFGATPHDNTVNLSWNISGEGNISGMQVERSSNGKTFDMAGTVFFENGSTQYNYTDHPLDGAGVYFYRIGLVSVEGEISYSPVRQVSIDKSHDFIIQRIAGSASGNGLQFTISTAEAGDYFFVVYDMNGTAMGSTRMSLSEGTQVIHPGNIPVHSGIYILRAIHKGQQRVAKLAFQ